MECENCENYKEKKLLLQNHFDETKNLNKLFCEVQCEKCAFWSSTCGCVISNIRENLRKAQGWDKKVKE